MMLMDLHTHSNYSDGKHSPEQIIETAISLGYRAIAITDHVWVTSDWVEAYAVHLEELKKTYESKIAIFTGVEAKVLNLQGDIDAAPHLDSIVDLILGSIHKIPNEAGYYSHLTIECVDPELVLSDWMTAFSGLMRNQRVNLVAHPMAELKQLGLKLNNRQREEVAHLLARSGKIVEINVKHQTPDPQFIQILKDLNTPLVVSSDSHSVEDLRKTCDLIRDTIDSFGLAPLDIRPYLKRKHP